MARPTKLTPELQEKIMSYLNSAVTIETACAACGIAARTYRAWLQHGREVQARLEEDPKARLKKDDTLYLEFLEASDEVLARVETRILAGINQSAQGYDVERTTEVYERDKKGNLVLMERKTIREREKDWKAGAFLAERRWAARWGAQQKVLVDGTVSVIGIDVIPPEGHDAPP